MNTLSPYYASGFCGLLRGFLAFLCAADCLACITLPLKLCRH